MMPRSAERGRWELLGIEPARGRDRVIIDRLAGASDDLGDWCDGVWRAHGRRGRHDTRGRTTHVACRNAARHAGPCVSLGSIMHGSRPSPDSSRPPRSTNRSTMAT